MKWVTYILSIKERKNVLSITKYGLWRSIDSIRFLFYHLFFHRSLLTARSAYFEAMLSGSWVESDSHEIKLEG